MINSTDGSDNVAVGAAALDSSSSGNRNVAIGAQAMSGASNGAAENVAVGRQAGFGSDAGESVYLGHRTGQDGNQATTSSGVTFLGARAGLASATQHNFLTALGYDAKGECDDCVILGRVTDVVGIGLLDPPGDGALQVNGAFRIGTSANYIGLVVSSPTTHTLELPSTQPAVGQVLKAATSGATSILDWDNSNIEPVSNTPIDLLVDNQSITVTNLSIQGIQSDDATPANRTFVIDTPFNGAAFTFIWVGANAGELLDNSAVGGAGTLRLNGDWLPQANDTITIRCADVAGVLDCFEVSRADNN
jgi:hypothetical protein